MTKINLLLIAFGMTLELLSLSGTANTFAADVPLKYTQLRADSNLVPQNLLKLIHTPEVREEIGMSQDDEAQLESLLRRIDKVWWPARNQPMESQRKVIEKLERELVSGLEGTLDRSHLERLRQIELQSQSSRALARPEVAKYLGLNDTQLTKIERLFNETEKLVASDKDGSSKEIQEARKNEASKAVALLTSAQSQKLKTILGKAFDTGSLSRIYSLAPELISSGHYFGSDEVDLASLRGKVVLVHFYAFQCHNCVANFDLYKKWNSELKKRGVEVVGIQTPETADESDPAKVISAATKVGFHFPVLIDVDRENWNAWGNTMWPTVYVVDKNGYIRFWWQGELNWQGAKGDQQIEQLINKLLAET